ncbi:RES domain protein [Neorhizobium galegae bv. orientalis str. HAMBI 540]|uniref:RES domain protein n=3 Tax=Neorhizobium galegae TaxID=399 RepID=A0A068SQX2_NEOGA|nr:RES domain protein [Neorhizobium galegae bv. orientalis str. HAMBI 540]
MSNVCYQCFGDDDLRFLIRMHAGPRGCYFCGRKDAATMPLDDLAEFIRERIEGSYSKAADDLPYESREGGYQAWNIDSWDMIGDELALDLPRDSSGSLFQALVDGIGDDQWCKYDWLVLEPDESLRFSWSRFCEIVKHQRRFFFHNINKSDGFEPDQRSPLEFLIDVCGHAQSLGLILEKPTSLALFRARPREARRPFWTPAELGPPPEEYATQSNRMNPPGIPMFYGADQQKLAVAEIRNTMASVGRFETTRPVRILDLASLPKVPGFFSMATRMDRLILRFLRQFAKLIIQPVERNDRVNVDYIPTQVFTEFLRDFEFDGGCIDGLRYRSATGEKGTNYVLFANQSDVFDAVTPEPSEQSNPWLRLVGVKQMRI